MSHIPVISHASQFARWYGRRLDSDEERLISALERQRLTQGFIRAFVHVNPLEARYVNPLLIAYTRYLHCCFLPQGTLFLVDRTLRRRHEYERQGFIVRSCQNRGSTQGFGTLHNAICINSQLYTRRGAPDCADNMVSSVPWAPGTSLIITGYFPSTGLDWFTCWYYEMRDRPDSTFLTFDWEWLPMLTRIPSPRKADPPSEPLPPPVPPITPPAPSAVIGRSMSPPPYRTFPRIFA